MIETADLYAAGKTQAQIAEIQKRSQTSVFDDLRQMKNDWREKAGETIAAWREQEIAYTTQKRLDAEVQYKRTNNFHFGELMVKWSHRLDLLLGIEAPKKFENWTEKSWEEFAKEKGLTEQDAIDAFEHIVNVGRQVTAGSAVG